MTIAHREKVTPAPFELYVPPLNKRWRDIRSGGKWKGNGRGVNETGAAKGLNRRARGGGMGRLVRGSGGVVQLIGTRFIFYRNNFIRTKA